VTTSANVTYYEVYKDGALVKEHSQHAYCKSRIREQLLAYVPAEAYTLILRWPDEEEEDHFSKEMLLSDYLNGVKVEWEDDDLDYYEDWEIDIDNE